MTAPFGIALENALKQNVQGGRLTMMRDVVVNPRFFCCLSGLNINKEPVVQSHLSVTRVCTGDPVAVFYNLSYSPSSTIAGWEVDWDDGNTSSGVWPGAGFVAHPGGGYTHVGIYNVRVTVYDLLGVEGHDVHQVEAVDCTLPLGVELYCSTDMVGVAGIWYTSDAGGNWADRAGEVLANTPVYDLKINPHTIPAPADFSGYDNTEFLELWAATEKGLYKCTDGARTGQSWKRITLPSQPIHGEPTPYAIAISKVDPLEVFILTYGLNGYPPGSPIWVYRTVDGGVTWNAGVEVGIQLGLGGGNGLGVLHGTDAGRTYSIDTVAQGGMVVITLPYYGIWTGGAPPPPRTTHVDIIFYFPDESDDWWIADSLGSDFDQAKQTWFGVYCDPLYSSVWVFGDENDNAKIEAAMNYSVYYIPNERYDPVGGSYFADYSRNFIGDPGWDVDARVCPIMPNPYWPSRYIEIVNEDAEAWAGRVSWQPSDDVMPDIDLDSHDVINNALPFRVQCGARSTWDADMLFIGRHDEGAGVDTDHFAVSIDGGMSWTERPGVGPNTLPTWCAITSIVFIGGMFE